MKRVLLVVDVSNLYYCTNNRFGKIVDYNKLKAFAEKRGELYRAIAYGSSQNGQASGFIAVLNRIGFETKFKEPKVFSASQRKSDWDVGIVIDVVRLIPRVDIVIFATADGDFAPAVEYVRSCGLEAVVVGSAISSDLYATANECVEITEDFL